jgi:hypothetical protein
LFCALFSRIFRQRLSLFETFNERVDTKNDVACIRKNIVLWHLKRTQKNDFNHPREIQKFIKFKSLTEKVALLKEKLKNSKRIEREKLNHITLNGTFTQLFDLYRFN